MSLTVVSPAYFFCIFYIMLFSMSLLQAKIANNLGQATLRVFQVFVILLSPLFFVDLATGFKLRLSYCLFVSYRVFFFSSNLFICVFTNCFYLFIWFLFVYWLASFFIVILLINLFTNYSCFFFFQYILIISFIFLLPFVTIFYFIFLFFPPFFWLLCLPE